MTNRCCGSREERDRFETVRGLELPDSPAKLTHALNRVVEICKRFPEVVQTCQSRYAQRQKYFDVTDEYDVQDLMHALLVATFEDVRAEDYVPSNSAQNSRIDFLLHREELGLELKMMRDSMSAKNVADQLILDIQRYSAHPKCKTLVFFVYDPARKLRNPQGLMNDLSVPQNGTQVVVLVAS